MIDQNQLFSWIVYNGYISTSSLALVQLSKDAFVD